jgi:VCBS repeat-containing protein
MTPHRPTGARRALSRFWDELRATGHLALQDALKRLFASRPARARGRTRPLTFDWLEERALPAVTTQWAGSVLDFTSQYRADAWSAHNATATPDVNGYGDIPAAWAPSSQNGTHEVLTLGYSIPFYASGVIVRETWGNGFVERIDLVGLDGATHTVFSGVDPSQPGAPVNFTTNFSTTRYLVTGVRVYVNTSHNLGTYEEIDAVGLLGSTVAPNSAPDSHADAFALDEDGSLAGNVLGNDADPDGDALTAMLCSSTSHGTLSWNADGSFTYTPFANYNGTDSFTYSAFDGIANSPETTVTLTINAVNDPPVARDDAGTVSEDGALVLNVLANDDSGPDAGETLSVFTVSQPGHGHVAVYADGTLTYTPDADYNGGDSFTYTLSDGNGGTALATVSLTVNPVNDPPVARDDAATLAEDGFVMLDVRINDDTGPDAGETLSVASVTQGAHGSVVVNADGSVTYKPAANYNGGDSFTYTVSDGNGGTATATVVLTVTPVNDPPVARADSATVSEDGSVTVSVLANDDSGPDGGETLAVTGATQGAHGAVVVNADGSLTYTPNANFNGTDSFTYTIGDGNGGTATATVSVTVGAVNDPPVARNDGATVSEDGSATINVLANDDSGPDTGETLFVAAVTQGAHGTVTVNAGTLTYTPNANYNGADSFSYTLSDGNGGTAVATVAVNVLAVNDAPVARNDSASVNEDGSVSVAVLANDDSGPDAGETLSVTSVTQGAHGSVVVNANGTVTYTPAANYNGSDSFSYTIGDGNGGVATATVAVTVNAVNDNPTAQPAGYSTPQGSALAGNLAGNAADADGDPLNFGVAAGPQHGTLVLNPNGSFTYTPAAGYVGCDSFSYKVDDGHGGTATALVSLTVTGTAPANRAPTATADVFRTINNTPVSGNVLANDRDPDGDRLTAALVRGPSHGTVSFKPDGSFTYTPKHGYVGSDTFTYRVSDGHGGTATATVTLLVVKPSDLVLRKLDQETTISLGKKDTTGNLFKPNVRKQVTVAAINGDPAKVGQTITLASGAKVTINRLGEFVYQHAPGKKRVTDTFTVTVSDGFDIRVVRYYIKA